MKIPETSANVGAYYGNEENGQWQPNGVMLDTGVGGGVVGSGDAGVHRAAAYPAPHAHHLPGYVMAGAYYPAGYPAPAPPDDFADYMWMENEEEFDKQVMQQLEEEALMEQCIEAMLEDEHRERRRPQHKHHATTSNGTSLSLEETVSRSTLNPLAAEFVPTTTRAAPPSEDKTDSPNVEEPAPTATAAPEATAEREETREELTSATEMHDATGDSKLEDKQAESPPVEVSATKEVRKEAPKTKQEAKKIKPQNTKSDTKIQPKKKEVKAVKSETTVDDRCEDAPAETPKPAPSQADEPTPSGPKPINYAAAARAIKPKKPPTTPVVTPTTPSAPPPKAEKPKKEPPKKTEPKAKTDRPIQRKNSAKTIAENSIESVFLGSERFTCCC